MQPNFRGGAFDAFVTKVNPSGTSLVYSTYLGGTEEDRGFRIALDGAGNVYVAGLTASSNFPLVSAMQPIFGGGSDAFITKLNPAGTISYSTFLGGSGLDGATGLAVNATGNAFVTGFTASTDFPVINAAQSTYNGGQFDAFAAQLSTTGGAITYATYLGGSGYDTGFDVAVDASNNAYVLGRTASTNFPTVNAVQSANGGSADVFITKLAAIVQVSGRVVTSDGRGLRNATVSITDSRGVRRVATTSSFGFFSFDNVSIGDTCTIRISSRLYRYSPQTVQVNGNLTLPDFVGLE